MTEDVLTRPSIVRVKDCVDCPLRSDWGRPSAYFCSHPDVVDWLPRATPVESSGRPGHCPLATVSVIVSAA